MIQNKGAPKTRRSAAHEASNVVGRQSKKKVKTEANERENKSADFDDFMDDCSNSGNSDSMNESSHSSSQAHNQKTDKGIDLDESGDNINKSSKSANRKN